MFSLLEADTNYASGLSQNDRPHNLCRHLQITVLLTNGFLARKAWVLLYTNSTARISLDKGYAPILQNNNIPGNISK